MIGKCSGARRKNNREKHSINSLTTVWFGAPDRKSK
jgi:hypothetical protein